MRCRNESNPRSSSAKPNTPRCRHICVTGSPILERRPDQRSPALFWTRFSGAGTTAMVAAQLGRRAIGIELNADYNRMAAQRIGKALRPATFVDKDAKADLPLLATKEGP